ncbi:peptidase M12 [Pseudomonas sp. TH41]|uniref:M12 family metallopeptidase n=1 Tax=Pseudomonas sp. TH41 TaxID=2796405 RepID=UPI00191352DF|nr:M12 family metallopeptidase [Pseudomonas sp. TH41]MBK5352231.1 peptidase M12 [Pseudomonas sp. TH41]
MNSILDYQPTQCKHDPASDEAAITENPADAGLPRGNRLKRSLVNYPKLWENGRALKIAFMNNLDVDHKQKIIDAARHWLPFVNLCFNFVDGHQGDIRIATENNKNSAVLGTNSLLVHPDKPTMNLGVNPEHEDFEVIVIHEFGHALGAMHEHQHPNANIPWDKPKVYEFYQNREMNPLSREQIDRHIFTPFNTSDAFYLPYDKTSIMHYPVPNTLTLGNWELPINRKISKKDKEIMKLLYPY